MTGFINECVDNASIYVPHSDDVISIALHTALSHLDKMNTYVRLLIIGSAFNFIVPSELIAKLKTLGFNTSLFNYILDFLTGSP